MQKKSLFIIFLVVFIDLLGFGLVIPILPYYTTDFGAQATEVGWLMAIYSLMQFLFAPVWGRLSDIFGRRPVIILSLLGTAGGMMIVGGAKSLAWLFAGRLLAGLFSGNISTATAYIADVTTEENRAKGMGIIGAGFGLGFIFGPAIGGVLSVYGYGAPAYLAAALAVLNASFAMLALPEPLHDKAAREANRTKRFDLVAIAKTLSNPATRSVVLIFFIVTMAFTQLEASFALYMLQKFGFRPREAGMLLGYMGVIMVLLQGGLIHRLSKKFGEAKLSQVGTFLMGIGLIALALVGNFNAAFIAMTLVALGNGMNNPALMSLVSKSAAPSERGMVMGVYQSGGSLARVLGPPVAGLLFDHMGLNAPMWISGVFMLVGCALGLMFWNKKAQVAQAT